MCKLVPQSKMSPISRAFLERVPLTGGGRGAMAPEGEGGLRGVKCLPLEAWVLDR